MHVLGAFQVDLGGGDLATVRVERAAGVEDDLPGTLVDIDLQSFVEPTFSRYTAAALAHAGEVFLLRTAGQTIGTCVCVRSWGSPDEALLLTMAIRAGWRGYGLGQRFVREVLDGLARDGVRAVSMLVGDRNARALRVYRDVGFEIEGEGSADPRSGEKPVQLRIRLEAPVDAVPFADVAVPTV